MEESIMKTASISKKWRLFMATTTVLTAMSGGLAGVGTTFADEGNNSSRMRTELKKVDVTLNKVEALNRDGLTPNTGLEMPEFEAMEKLPGAKFAYYDITDAYYDKLDDYNGNHSDLIQAITANHEDWMRGMPGETGPTDDDGKTTVTLPASDEFGFGKVYLIVETQRPDNVMPSVPMVLALPITTGEDEDKTELEDIQLYPKNYGIDKVMLDKDGNPVSEGENPETANVSVGDVIDYQVKFQVPHDIDKMVKNANGVEIPLYEHLQFMDAMEGAEFVRFTSATTAAGEMVDEFKKSDGLETNFTEDVPNEDGEGTTTKNILWRKKFDLSDPDTRAELGKHAGRTMTIKYEVRITSDLVINELENNVVELDLKPWYEDSWKQNDPAAPVLTGGFNAEKVDKKGSDKLLPGAEFILKKGDLYAQFLKKVVNEETGEVTYVAIPSAEGIVEPDDIKWLEEDEKDGATILISSGLEEEDTDENEGEGEDEGVGEGEDEGVGEGEGEGEGEETQPTKPKGLLGVKGLEYGTYTLVETKAPDGYVLPNNATTTVEINKDSFDAPTLIDLKIPNLRTTEGSLPLTGSVGILTVILIGGGLMGAAAISRKKKEN